MNNPETRRDDLPDTAWASDGLCADMPAEIFDGATARLQTAKAACAKPRSVDLPVGDRRGYGESAL